MAEDFPEIPDEEISALSEADTNIIEDKIKQQIGNMIPDDPLNANIENAYNDMFEEGITEENKIESLEKIKKLSDDLRGKTDVGEIKNILTDANIKEELANEASDYIAKQNEAIKSEPLQQGIEELAQIQKTAESVSKTGVGSIWENIGEEVYEPLNEKASEVADGIGDGDEFTVNEKGEITTEKGDTITEEDSNMNEEEKEAVTEAIGKGVDEKKVDDLKKSGDKFWTDKTTETLIEAIKKLLPYIALGAVAAVVWHLVKKLVNNFRNAKSGCFYHKNNNDAQGEKLINFTCNKDWATSKGNKSPIDGNTDASPTCSFKKGYISVNPPCNSNGKILTDGSECRYNCFRTDNNGYSQCMKYTTPSKNTDGMCPFNGGVVEPIGDKDKTCPHVCELRNNLASLVCKPGDPGIKTSSEYCDCSIINCPPGSKLTKVNMSFMQGLVQMPLEGILNAIKDAGKDIFGGGEWWHYILYAIGGIIVIVGGYYLIRFMTGLFGKKSSSSGKEQVDININKTKFRMKGKKGKRGGKKSHRIHSRK